MIERNVIGMMLFDIKVAEKCIEELKLIDFSEENYNTIFFLAKKLYSGNKTIDLLNIVNEAEKTNIQGLDFHYIKDIVNEVDTTAQISDRIKDLKEQSYRRSIMNYATELFNKAKASEFQEVLNATANPPELIQGKQEKDTGQMMQDSLDRMAMRYKTDGMTVPGNETGFKHLDNLTGGIKNGELIFVSADPNVGKSILAHQIAINTAKKHKHVLSINFEMNEEQIGDRTMAIGLPFEIQKIKSPKQYLQKGDLEKLKNCPEQKILDEYLHIKTDTSNKTLGYIKSHCKKIIAKHGSISLIVVDYLQLMGGDNEDWENAGKNCAGLKGIAGEFNCPVIAIASLNKDGKTRGSGQIDFDIDQKWFLVREHDAREEKIRAKTELQIKKNRDGGKGIVDMIFQEKFIRFLEVD